MLSGCLCFPLNQSNSNHNSTNCFINRGQNWIDWHWLSINNTCKYVLHWSSGQHGSFGVSTGTGTNPSFSHLGGSDDTQVCGLHWTLSVNGSQIHSWQLLFHEEPGYMKKKANQLTLYGSNETYHHLLTCQLLDLKLSLEGAPSWS